MGDKNGKLLNFKGKSERENTDITDSGEFGNLRYEIYGKWNTIHIIDDKCDDVFKKDCDVFETAFEEIDFDSLNEGESVKIEGSGDNADLIITFKDDDTVMHLEEKKLPGIRNVLNILKKAKRKVLG